MLAHAILHPLPSAAKDIELFSRIQDELMDRYSIDEKLACEMTMDLFEVITAVDGNITMLEKYFLH